MLPQDVLGLLAILAPYEFLTVSHGLNTAANAAIRSQMVVVRAVGGPEILLIGNIRFEKGVYWYAMTTPRTWRRWDSINIFSEWRFMKEINGKLITQIYYKVSPTGPPPLAISARDYRLFQKTQGLFVFCLGQPQK
jgi:hypothetical protein